MKYKIKYYKQSNFLMTDELTRNFPAVQEAAD